jgi:hypothetical protein
MHTRVNQRTGVLFPWPPKKYRGIKPSAVGSAQRVRERTGVTEGKAGGMGSLGHEQLEWLENDLKGRSTSTPIVLFAHIPLWTIYPDLGNRRQRTSLVLRQAFRFRDCVEWTYSPDHAKGGGQGFVPHSNVDCLPATCPGSSAISRTDEGASRAVAKSVGHHRRELRSQRSKSCGNRFTAQQLTCSCRRRART